MFNFCEVFVGRAMVIDADRANTCKRIFKVWLQSKVQNMKDLSKTRILTGKQFEDFRRQEEQKHFPRPFKSPREITRTLKASTEYGLRKQEKIN